MTISKPTRLSALFVCLLIALFTVISTSAQHTPYGNTGFEIVRKNERVELYRVLTLDTEANETEDRFYIPLNREELIELRSTVPDTKSANGDVFQQTFKLTSDRPDIVSVVNDRWLLATGKRGDARITLNRLYRTLTADDVKNNTKVDWKVDAASFTLGQALNAMPRLTVRIENNVDRRIIAVPRLKTYKAVRDTYGKGIAKNFVVVAIDINNSNSAKQFLVQNTYVSFDPHQCEGVADVWAGVYGSAFRHVDTSLRNKKNDRNDVADYTPAKEKNECIDRYIEYFGFPSTIMPTDSSTMLAIAEAEKYRSPRYRLFQGIKFVSDVGSALPAFNILGPDGRTGFNFLGGTLTTALDAALPKIAEQKLANLRADVPKSNVIVKGNSTETINIFIPIEHIFSNTAWRKYRAEYKDKEYDPHFARHMLLFLVASSNGILIDENSKQVDSKQGGGAPFRNL